MINEREKTHLYFIDDYYYHCHYYYYYYYHHHHSIIVIIKMIITLHMHSPVGLWPGTLMRDPLLFIRTWLVSIKIPIIIKQ